MVRPGGQSWLGAILVGRLAIFIELFDPPRDVIADQPEGWLALRASEEELFARHRLIGDIHEAAAIGKHEFIGSLDKFVKRQLAGLDPQGCPFEVIADLGFG